MKIVANTNNTACEIANSKSLLDAASKENKLTQVAIDALKDTAVTIYHNTSQFSDYFSAKIASPETELCYRPILFGTGASKGFIHLDEAKGEIFTQISSVKRFDLNSYTNSLVGKNVTFYAKDGEKIQGKLLGQDGQKFTLFTFKDEGSALAFIARDQVAFIDCEGLEQAIDVKPYFKAKYVTDKSSEDIKGQIIFINNALRWTADYRLIVEETEFGLKGRWVAQASITNNSQLELKDLMVKVVGGDLNEAHGGARPGPCFNEMRAMCASSAPKAAIEQSWQDLKAYLIPHRLSLKPQETLSTRLYDPQDISITKRHILHSYEHQSGQAHPSVCYHLDNSLEGDLGHAYPKGEVQVYRKEDRFVDFIGKHTINQTPKGEDIDVVTGESFDLTSKRASTKENIRDSKGKVIAHEITVNIELANGSDEDQSVFLHEHVYGDIELLSASLPISKKDAQELVFKVDVAKNTTSKDPVVFTYKYRKDIN